MRFFPKLLLCTLLFSPAHAFAELPKQVENDLSVISGLIIMQVGDEYLIDLDDRDNLNEGDILTVVTPGESIIHPETKVIIGSVDIPVGFLQVTRINSGYSYATLLSAEVKPKSNATVRRFEQVPALFVDNRGDGESFAGQLKLDLPHFNWLQEGDATPPMLTFDLAGDALTIKNPDGNYLYSYAVTGSQQIEPPPETPERPFVVADDPKAKTLQQAAVIFMSALNIDGADQFMGTDIGIVRQGAGSQHGVWMGPNIPGNPVGIAVDDLDGDGLQDIAVALNHQLLIGQVVEGKYLEKANLEIGSGLKILSLDAIDLDNDGIPELCLTAVDNLFMSSFVVKYTGSEYERVIRRVPWYLRVAELPGGERVLIGQYLSNGDTNGFQGEPFQVLLDGDRLVRGDELDLPGLANMFSFVPFADQKGQLHYAYLTHNDKLKVVSAEGEDLWESGTFYGGSESCFENRVENKGDSVVPTCLRPRLVKTPTNEILVVQNDGQRILTAYKKYKKSRLHSMRWNGFALVDNWQTTSQQGYLADYALADADNDGRVEVAMVVKFKHAGVVAKARSAIVIYELK